MILRVCGLVPIALAVAGLSFGVAVGLPAQAKPDDPHPVAQKLSEQEKHGENLFLQRCSLCHLPRKLKFGSPPVVGPSLAGQFRDATPENLKTLRGFIEKGGPDMPGFRYGLESKEIDDLIEYLKTQ